MFNKCFAYIYNALYYIALELEYSASIQIIIKSNCWDTGYVFHEILNKTLITLTHCTPVMPYGNRDLNLHWFIWCLMAPSNCQNQHWLVINGVLCHSMCSEITLSKLLPHLPGTNELNHLCWPHLPHEDLQSEQTRGHYHYKKQHVN